MSTVSFRLATPLNRGAVAIIDLFGPSEAVLQALTTRSDWPIGKIRFSSLAGIDDGIVVRINDEHVQLMPHGGLRVWQRLRDELIGLGAQPVAEVDPQAAYPEAGSRDEALMLATLAKAASPLAIDRLLEEPRRWSQYRANPTEPLESIRQRSHELNRLVVPPRVVIAGRPNAGKSTLTNALCGRSAAITSEVAGTTRDYIGVSINLAGLVVHWFDTPGRQDTNDPIEQEAIRLTHRVIQQAHLIVAVREPEGEWPELGRRPDLRVLLKGDRLSSTDPRPTADLILSARSGDGLAELVAAVRECLVSPATLTHPGPWLFDERLIEPETT